MRILVLSTDGFGGQGGIAKYNRDLLRALAASPRVCEVVVVPRSPPDPAEPTPAKLIHRAAGTGKLEYTRACARVLADRSGFALVLCAHINLLPFAYAASRRHRAPLILCIHGIEAWQPHARWLNRALAPRVSGVLSVSALTRERFCAWAGVAPERCRVLPNTVELSRFAPGEKPTRLLDRYRLHERKVLMTLGRLAAAERYKGIDEVLAVLPHLRAAEPSLAYLVVGDGDDRSRLEGEARRRGLGDCVVFTGRIAEADKAEHYRLADAYVMPSHGEGFGIVFLEAMASGIPVVASRTDGGREAVREGRLGVLVDPADRADLERGIREALARPRGQVPDGLEHFAFPVFQARVQEMISELRV